jgi:hypothetical protein
MDPILHNDIVVGTPKRTQSLNDDCKRAVKNEQLQWICPQSSNHSPRVDFAIAVLAGKFEPLFIQKVPATQVHIRG